MHSSLKPFRLQNEQLTRNAAQIYMVDIKRIQEWRKQGVQLRSVANPARVQHLPGCGRPFEIEEELVEWVSIQITQKEIQRKTDQLTIFKQNSFSNSFGKSSYSKEANDN